jgi:hypothetical protein
MTRSILAVVTVVVGVWAVSGTGCKQTGVGDPCVPEQEYDPTFNGFDPKEVSVESKSFQCQTRLCLVNHFQGRVSCPYGQDSNGTPTLPAKNGCVVPGTTTPITGEPNGTKAVPSQCIDRNTDKAVYCSCRCADVNGKQPSSEGVFCSCPDGYACVQLVGSIGANDTGLTGGYCIKDGTDYNPATSCQQSFCGDGDQANCPNSFQQ